MNRLLLPLGALVTLAFSLLHGSPFLLPILLLSVSLLGFIPLPRGREAFLERAGRLLNQTFSYILPLVTLGIVLFYGWLWGARAFGFQPVVHDEFAYLFQAETFAAGRISYPPPPAPEFFDAFHILTEPVYASKYPPGHALVLAAGVLLGAPWLVVLLSVGVSLVLLGHLARPCLGAPGALALVLFFGLSPAEIQTATTYLSQNTFLLAALGTLCLFRRGAREARLLPLFLTGASLGYALLIRPFNGALLGALLLLLALSGGSGARRLLRPRPLAIFLLPLLLMGGAGVAYNRGITGSALTAPWSLYSERTHPEDTLGFAKGPIAHREVGPGKRMWIDRVFRPNYEKYTPRFAAEVLFRFRLPATILEAMPVALLVLLPGLFARGGSAYRRAALFAAAAIVLWNAGYFFYWSTWVRYYHEVTPALLFLPLLGARVLVRGGRGPALAAVLLVLVALVPAADRLSSQIAFRSLKASELGRFRARIERTVPEGSIVFIRYGPRHNPDLDLIDNEPDLSKAPRIFVYDHGAEQDRRFVEEHFPGRKPWFYDEGKRRLVPGIGES
ncbi:MAG: glycosyltransferase family 39 protein [Candidatus Eisenbacteria bacterium]